jgi:hypothetical protein
MPKVKIFLTQHFADDNYSTTLLRDSISDWEEITDEELKFLRNNIHKLNIAKYFDMEPTIVALDEAPVIERIQSIKAVIAKEKENERRTKAEAEERKQERALKKMAKTKQQELALLTQLAKTHKDSLQTILGKI